MRKLRIFLLLLALVGITITFLIYTRGLRKQYEDAVSREAAVKVAAAEKLSEADLKHLPAPIQKYIRLTGFVNKDKIRNFRVVWDGALRSDARSLWMSATMLQENFLQNYSRDFYLTAFMKGLPVSVWHSYHNAAATMQVKIISLFPVVDLKGEELTTAETVTLFNDMCILAPGALVDERISWREISNSEVEATFTNGKYKIRARLKFNPQGELTDFVSDDRYYLTPENKLRRERWSTPLTDYREIGGHRLATRGEAVWHLAEGAYAYGKFVLKKVEYNVY